MKFRFYRDIEADSQEGASELLVSSQPGDFTCQQLNDDGEVIEEEQEQPAGQTQAQHA